MLFSFDDEIWKTIINGGYGALIIIVGYYLNFKLNIIQKRQIENTEKIDVAAKKADVAAKKADVAATTAKEVTTHLDIQDSVIHQVKELTAATVEKIEEVHRSTNGLKDQLVDQAKRAALAEGKILGLAAKAEVNKEEEHQTPSRGVENA